MKKKKKPKKKKKIEKKEKVIKEKDEKSELVEEVEEEETPNISKFSQFIEVKPRAPVLEREIKEEIPTLEQEVGGPAPKEKEQERKYEETVKYDVESEYQESLKRQREITPEMISQVAPVSSIDLERVGRKRIRPGQEFHMGPPVEMPSAPPSEEYDIVPVKKSKKFRGEKTAFQEGLERRYDTK